MAVESASTRELDHSLFEYRDAVWMKEKNIGVFLLRSKGYRIHVHGSTLSQSDEGKEYIGTGRYTEKARRL